MVARLWVPINAGEKELSQQSPQLQVSRATQSN
jgi:hypothetical protein